MGIWHPLVCPLNETIVELGIDLNFTEKVTASQRYDMAKKHLTRIMKTILDAKDDLSELHTAIKIFEVARDRLHRASFRAQSFQTQHAYTQAKSFVKELKRDIHRVQFPDDEGGGTRRRLLNHVDDNEGRDDDSRDDVGNGDVENGDIEQMEHKSEVSYKNHENQKEVIETLRMKEANFVSDLRSKQGLDLPIPSDCHVEDLITDNGNMVLVQPSCGCDGILARANARGFLSTKEIVGTCKTALSHYAWKTGCQRQRERYLSRCMEYNNDLDLIKEKERSIEDEGQQHLYHNVHLFSKYFMSSKTSRNQCIALKQVLNLRCIEENELIGSPNNNTNGEHRFIPRSPFDEKWEPLLPLKNLTAKQMRFQQIDPKITTGNFGARIPEFLTPVKAFRPFFIHPSRKNVHLNKAEREALSKRPIRFQGIVMEWLRENAVCMAGKPPLPRRSMAAAGPFKDGDTYLLFGGYGSLPINNGSSDAFAPGDKLNSQANVQISGLLDSSNMKRDWVTFADTFLIHDLKSVPEHRLCGFGMGDGKCQGTPYPAPIPKIPENIYNGEGNDNPNPEVLHHAAYNEPRKRGLPNEPFKTDEPSWYPWRNKEPGAQIEPKNPKTDWVGKKYGQNTVSIENV